MYSIENVEVTSVSILKEYATHFGLNWNNERDVNIINIARELSKIGMLTEQETLLFEHPSFLNGYTLSFNRGALMPLFLDYSKITRVQYAAIYALQFVREPYYSYLQDTLNKNDIKFVPKVNRRYNSGPGYANYIVSTILRNEEMKKRAESEFKSNIFVLNEVPIYEQYLKTEAFLNKLSAVHPHITNCVLGFDYGSDLNVFLTFETEDGVNLIEKIGEPGYWDKLKALCLLLDTSGLILKEKSLTKLKVNKFGYIIITDIKESRIDESLVLGYNWKQGMKLWEKETIIPSSVTKEELSDWEEDEEESEDNLYEGTDY